LTSSVDANGNKWIRGGDPGLAIYKEGGVVSVKEDKKNISPTEFLLSQNYPNPFNPNTTIAYSIANPGLVSVKIFNILGEEVEQLVNEYKNTGSYSVNFDASKLSSGIYFYSLSSGSFVQMKKMIVLK